MTRTATFQLTQADHLAYLRLVVIASLPLFALYIFSIFLIFLLFGFYMDDLKMASVMSAAALATFFALSTLSYFVLMPHNSKKIWKEHVQIREPMTFIVEEHQFSIKQPSGQTTAQWTNMARWNEDGKVFAIHIAGQLAYVIPKRCVDGDFIDFVRNRLIESGLPKKGKPRK